MDELRDDLSHLAAALREHLQWLERGGVAALPRARAAREKPATSSSPLPITAPIETASAAPSPPEAAPVKRPAAAPLPAPARVRLEVVREELGDCQRCKLAPTRQNIVFGVGNPNAPVVFVGEGPGADEDKTGEPFVGRAGQLLTRMIAAMGFERSDVYICNVVKCRPPGNRTPEPDEVSACEPFLQKQLASIAPRIIVALGKSAAAALLKTDAPISSYRGKFTSYQGIPLMPTFHPAYLLRNPPAKREVWADLQLVMKELDRLGIPRGKAPAADAGE